MDRETFKQIYKQMMDCINETWWDKLRKDVDAMIKLEIDIIKQIHEKNYQDIIDICNKLLK